MIHLRVVIRGSRMAPSRKISPLDYRLRVAGGQWRGWKESTRNHPLRLSTEFRQNGWRSGRGEIGTAIVILPPASRKSIRIISRPGVRTDNRTPFACSGNGRSSGSAGSCRLSPYAIRQCCAIADHFSKGCNCSVEVFLNDVIPVSIAKSQGAFKAELAQWVYVNELRHPFRLLVGR